MVRSLVVLSLLLGSLCGVSAQVPQDGVLKLGGFRCIDLRPLKNDHYLDLYRTGYWAYASMRMDVWKRMGVPYWQPEGCGNLRVAGSLWRPENRDVIPGTAYADAQAPGNGAIAYANDGDPTTYWYAGDGRPHGKLWIEFAAPEPVRKVRFLSWDTPRHAPKDYVLGLILPGGARKPLIDVLSEKRLGQWIVADAGNTVASGVYIDVASTQENEHGPVIYELQALGKTHPVKNPFPDSIEVPLHDQCAEELFCLGNVGGGFQLPTWNAEVPLGEYVLHYVDGRDEVVPLVGGRNVAPTRYGTFVPEAQFAWGLVDPSALLDEGGPTTFYHLDEMLPVEPKRQLMAFSYAPKRPKTPLRSLTFRCTNPSAYLILQGLTLRESGPRMNVLVANGKRMSPVPEGTPKAKPSMLEAYADKAGTLLLDGTWLYRTDPGNRGVHESWYEPKHDAKAWGKMPVPSQWYVQGLDYHGVVWFRREVKVPRSFPGQALKLEFERVDYDARVWVNGVFVGRHLGAYSSFSLDVTRALRKGEPNTIVVRVDSPLDPGFEGYKTLAKGNAMDDISMPYSEEGSMGGIYRHVRLVGTGDVDIEEPWAWSTVSQDLRSAKVHVSMSLAPKPGAETYVSVSCRLTELLPSGDKAKPRVFEVERLLHLQHSDAATREFRDENAGNVRVAEVIARTSVNLELDVPNPRLWYPWEQGEPNLHLLEIEVRRGTELVARHVSRVGIKEVEIYRATGTMMVNHHRIFVKGMLNDDVHWQSLMDRTGYRQRIQQQKDANLNLIRVITHESSPDFYDLCDEMGMMVWQEMPLQWGYSSKSGVRDQILPIVRETVTQTRPHACVVAYSAWNEGGQYGFTQNVTDLIGSLDPSRPMTKACGGGDFDVHLYPTQYWGLTRRTFLWSGIEPGFISETGAYGMATMAQLHKLYGKELFPFDGADYLWEVFSSYRWICGPVFLDAPRVWEWPVEKVRAYVESHADASTRWLAQVMKSMFETTRGQRFAPTTSCIHCRYDDAFPSTMLGIVNFNGQPLAGYYGVQQACQPVLPLLRFDAGGAEDLRVVNDYWARSWKGCNLRYTLWSRDGKLLRERTQGFDLPADSTVKVLSREEVGDLWGAGGFKAELVLTDAAGKKLSENSYDFTAEECRAWVTSVYPVAPVKPYGAQVLRASEAVTPGGSSRIALDGGYSPYALDLSAQKAGLQFKFSLREGGEVLIRPACDDGAGARQLELYVDGVKAELESYPQLDMNEMITRGRYSSQGLAWFPGWHAKLAVGEHMLEFRAPKGKAMPKVRLDAVSVQPVP